MSLRSKGLASLLKTGLTEPKAGVSVFADSVSLVAFARFVNIIKKTREYLVQPPTGAPD